MTYSMRYSVRYSLRHSESCFVVLNSMGSRSIGFSLEKGFAVHSFGYDIRPMLRVVGFKLRSVVYHRICIIT